MNKLKLSLLMKRHYVLIAIIIAIVTLGLIARIANASHACAPESVANAPAEVRGMSNCAAAGPLLPAHY